MFVSYAIKDAELFKIEEIAKRLTEYDEIKEVYYCEKHITDNIMEYMDEYLGKSHVLIIFCSENALNSIPVKKEWTAADMMDKPIIPVFLKPEHIPPLLKSRLGLEFDLMDMEKNIVELHNLLLKKCQSSDD